jgi:hypothetical protein
MSTDNGWVDFEAVYGSKSESLSSKSGDPIVTRAGNSLELYASGTTFTKRFSISKAPDGKIGLSYNLKASVAAIRVTEKDGTLSPPSVSFSATYNEDSIIKPFLGFFEIAESKDGLNYETRYESSSSESAVYYTPSPWLENRERFIQATLKDQNGTTLDTQGVLLLVDAEGLGDEIDAVTEGVQTVANRVTIIESGMDGVTADLTSIQSDYYGLTNGTLLWQPVYTYTETLVTLTARLYRAGEDVTTDYPSKWFSWALRTESGEEDLGTGYSVSFPRTKVGFGGVAIGRFTEHLENALSTRSGEEILTRSGKQLELYIIK